LVFLALHKPTTARVEPATPADPSNDFREAALRYATHLASTHRDSALLELQENLGWIFHSQSANHERIRLGEMALDAAVRERDRYRQISILVDDLGWANHMDGNDTEAISNLDRALELLDDVPASQRVSLQRAKALRHRAIIRAARSTTDAKRDLERAEIEVATALPEGNERDIEIDQLRHAEALGICLQLGVLEGKLIRPGDTKGLRRAADALELARRAKAAFAAPGEWQLARYAKAVYLEHALLNALGRTAEAREAKTLLDDALTRSTWDPSSEPLNVKGV
jgi:hypothetical protein